MRRFYFILITCIFSLSISAQRVINPNQRKEQTVIDKVQYRVTYRTKSVQNTENKDERGGYIYSSDDMRLDIGSKLSKFYSYSKEAYEAKMLEYYQKGSFDTRPKMNGGALSWVLYRNYPTGKTLYLDAVLMDEFRVEEPMEQPDWQLVPDSVATILGYNCHMARTIYKGRMDSMVHRGHSARQWSVETVRFARTDTPCLRFRPAICFRWHRTGTVEWIRRCVI